MEFMNKNNILGIVITYNADVRELIENICQYLDYINELIVWQNSLLSEAERQQIIDYTDKEKVTFQGNGNNVGIAAALNWSISYAKTKNYQYLMSMDQDSYWVNAEHYLKQIALFDDSKALIFGPKTISVDDGEQINHTKIEANVYREVDFVITSGAIYDIKLFSEIGLFPKEYFIDAIDEEICYRALKYGYKTVCIQDAFLKQHFGEHTHKKILGRTIIVANYAAFRYFYIVRNHIWLANSGLVKGKTKWLIIYNYVFSPLLKVLLIEKNKGKKLKAIFKGVFLGLFNIPKKEKLN